MTNPIRPQSNQPKPSQSKPSQSKPSNWLLEYRHKVTSQFGEDGILRRIFATLPNLNYWCVEFGAGDGQHLSNTYSLIQHLDWFSVQIEANSESYQKLLERYKNNDRVICLNQMVDFEGDSSLEQILSKVGLPEEFDFLSIDVDGNDYHIWDSLKRFRPKVLCIEFNPTIPHYVSYIQPRDFNVYQGSSLAAMVVLGKQKGYELIASTECNGIFVDQQYFPLFEIQDNSIWKMNQNFELWTHVFQLYDGTIVVGGNDTLIWHNIKLDLRAIQELVQVLPVEERVYPQRISKP